MPAVNAQDDVLAVVFRQWAGNPTGQLQRAIRKRVKAVGGAVTDDHDLLTPAMPPATRPTAT